MSPSRWLHGDQQAEFTPAVGELSRAAADACRPQSSCDVASRCFQQTCLEHATLLKKEWCCRTRRSLSNSRQVKDTSNQLSRALTHKRSKGSEATNMRTIMADMTAQPLAPGGAWAAPAIDVKTQPACVHGISCSETHADQ